MANPADVNVRGESRPNGELATLVGEFNKMVTNLRVLTAKLDADTGVTDTNFAALVTDTAVSGPSKITTIMG